MNTSTIEVLRRPVESALATGIAVMHQRDIGAEVALSERHP
jgi:hypothetical protein